MKTADSPIIVEQLFDKPIAEVWSAITELDQMTHWFFSNIPEFRYESGVAGWSYFIKESLVAYINNQNY